MEWLTKELLTVYGPLAMGWIWAVIEYRKNGQLNAELHKLATDTTQAVTRLTVLFEERMPRP